MTEAAQCAVAARSVMAWLDRKARVELDVCPASLIQLRLRNRPAHKDGAVQGGAVQVCVGQVGVGQESAGQVNSAQNDSRQISVVQAGAFQIAAE